MHKIARTIHTINTLREGVLRKYGDTPLLKSTLDDVRRVVVINSSSRSGSSLLYALLRKLPGVYALTGEAAPFYKLNTSINGFNIFESDKIPSELLEKVVDYRGLSRDFLSDMYCCGGDVQVRDIDVNAYADDLAIRFLLQWPDVDFTVEGLRACVFDAFGHYARLAPAFDTENFYVTLLKRVAAAYPRVNPYYYDINTDKVTINFPHLDIPTGPPSSHFTIEEPPFILLPPGRKATPADLSEKTLLLKSTVDCYRMNLIERIFRNADLRIIHLVRNPAATTNGIYDGWLHRGFFSHNLRPHFQNSKNGKGLGIKGYSDEYSYGAFWWNFDLPDGWQEYAGKELVDVCSFQWYSANAEILKNLSRGRRDSCTVRFENIIRDLDSRREEFGRMLAFMGQPAADIEAVGIDDLPIVQSTLPPQRYRWKKRRHLINRLLDDPIILDMSRLLGYPKEKMEEWL